MRFGRGLTAGAVFAGVWLVAGFLPAKGLEYQFVADSTFYYKTGRQAVVPAGFDFNDLEKLRGFPLSFDEWQGEGLSLANRPVVKPDFMLERNYQDRNGQAVWFQLIRGRIERAVHVPAICYYNAGWRILEQGADGVKMGDVTVPCGRIVAQRGDQYATELYFYLWADPKRDFMKGCVMFRVSAMGPEGGTEERLRLLKKFIRDVFSQAGKTSS